MFPNFEDLENRNTSDVSETADDIQQFLNSLENNSVENDQNHSPAQSVFSYLESINQKYSYEKTELSNGIVKESVVRETHGSTTRDAADFYNVKDAEVVWHIAQDGESCATACQTFILNEYITNPQDLADLADENVLIDDFGDEATAQDIGSLLEYHGIETATDYNANLRDLKNELDRGNRVIVSVDNLALDGSYDGVYPSWGTNHTVEVIGIDNSNPERIRIIINDPAAEDGCGKIIDEDTFMAAWGSFGRFMMTADRV